MVYLGHCSTIICAVLFTLCFIVFQGSSLVGQIFYRTLFFSTTITYALSLYQRFGGVSPSFYVLLRMGSFQYGALGALWLISRWHWIKIVPFVAISVLQASGFVASDLQPGTPLARQIEDLKSKYIGQVSSGLGYVNLLIYARIILEVLTIRPGSTVATFAFSLFYRIRSAYSPDEMKALTELKQIIDTKIQNPKTPAKVKQLWENATKSAESYDRFELDPKQARVKAELKKKVMDEDREAAIAARETFQSELKVNGTVAEL